MSDNHEQSDPPAAPNSQVSTPTPRSTDPPAAHEGFHHLVTSEGKVHVLPHWLGRLLHLPEDVRVVDLRFASYSRNYLVQSGMAVIAMLVVLIFVDSLADAALAAGLGSSIVILFVHPSSPAAKTRSVVGGYSLALMVGACALLIFSSPVGLFLDEFRILFDLTLALAIGLLILVMALTDTEHPPAAGTVMGVALQPWDPLRIGIIIGAVIMLVLIKRVFRNYLEDLI